MTKGLRLLLLAFVLTAVSSEVLALSECVDAASANVWKVESGGLWKSGGQNGNFRVVLTKTGVEHAQDKIQLQIIQLDGAARKVVRCVDLDAPGLQGYVTEIRVHAVSDVVAAVELSIEMKAMESVILGQVYLVSSSGAVKAIQKANYADISDFE